MRHSTVVRFSILWMLGAVTCGTGVAVIAQDNVAPAEAVTAQPSDPLAQLRFEIAALKEMIDRIETRLDEQETLLRKLEASPAGTVAPATMPEPATSAGKAQKEKTQAELDLEKKLAEELGAPSQTPSPQQPSSQPSSPSQTWSPAQPIVLAGGGKNFLNLSFDALATAGTSTTSDVGLIETGGHDPAQRGFTVQNVETVLEGAVDPYFRGQGNIVLQIDENGDTVVELEEAYLTSTSLPHNLQVKAGQFFTEFGRLNPQHPHTWDFVDQPLVNGRFLGGDGLRGPGARVSWLLPTRFYSEVFLGAQNSQGETAASFRDTPGETLFGRLVQDRSIKAPGDLIYAPRYSASFDLSDTQTVLLGVSGAFGPNGTGSETRTAVYGLDLFWKWKPVNAQAGFPFLKWQSEAMLRRYETGAFTADTNGDGVIDVSLPAETLKDWGAYSQVVWGFRRGWVAGLRADYVTGDDGAFEPDPMRATHWRVSPNLTWFPTEFSKLRLQMNHDEMENDGSEESLWLQFEFILGAHAAHKF